MISWQKEIHSLMPKKSVVTDESDSAKKSVVTDELLKYIQENF